MSTPPPATDEDQDLLEFFYQCPVGLISSDGAGVVRRLNSAAVRLLAPVAGFVDLSQLMPVLDLICPPAAAALRDRPEDTGRLSPDRRLFASVPTDPHAEPVGLELQLVRVHPDLVMTVVLDVTEELRVTAQERADTLLVQHQVLSGGASRSPEDLTRDELLALIAASAAGGVHADAARILLLDGDAVRVLATVGDDAVWAQEGVDDLLVQVVRTGVAATVRAGSGQDPAAVRPMLLMPISAAGGIRGALVVGRDEGRGPFSAAEVQRVELLAGQASVLLELAEARVGRDLLSKLNDRELESLRLHDEIIQRLFATGLQFERLAYLVGNGTPDERVLEQISGIDAVIRQLRATLTDSTPSRA